MDELAECADSQDSVVEGARKCDAFSKAIDIAVCVHDAMRGAAKAEEKAMFIEKMAVNARAEVDGLHVLAENMATMAANVATISLDSCKYQSYWDAFSKHEEYSKKIDFESFMNVVNGSCTKKEDRLGMYRSSGKAHNFPARILREDSTDSVMSSPSDSVRVPSRDMALSRDYPRQIAAQHRNVGARSGRRASLPAALKHPGDLVSDTDDDSGSEKFQERFPHTPSQTEYKETLASSFDNSSSGMIPLWEDRYVHKYRKGEQIIEEPDNSLASPQRWSEKKAIKQLNIKLHKQDDAEATSSNMQHVTVGRESREQMRTELPGIPRNGAVAKTELKTEDENYDDEVDEILRTNEPLQMQKIRNLENRGAGSQNLHLSPTNGDDKLPTSTRSVSPLLSNSERGAYTVEEIKHPTSPKTIQKHIYQPHEKSNTQ